ncbi:MAG TPA: pilus assembly protein [Aromatoleum sp.]|uniref:pilus assembly protein n=1 Tax=Aromatoleum sp. TaxID=2307007 RepID=UPI002B490618|nr:pilus assembly protein [Aromatoleum sp.]HJV26055.1 pilus assembly protein [Aromatoleum sp.]
MKKQWKLPAAVAILSLSGCVATSPDYDARFGDAVRTVSAEQVIAPNASRNMDPVKGIDGKAAEGTMREYAKGYAQPQQQSGVFTIGVGSGSSR